MKPYSLSGRQRKELADRATCLTIAVPVPLGWPAHAGEPTRQDMVDLIVQSVDGILPQHVLDARETEVMIDPLSRAGSLPPIIDQQMIDQGHLQPGQPYLLVAAVVAKVAFAARYRAHNSGPRWPGIVNWRPAGAPAGGSTDGT